MLTIFVSIEFIPEVEQILLQEDRLNEIVFVRDIKSPEKIGKFPYLSIIDNEIIIPLRWDNSTPPYLLPSLVPFSKEKLLGLIFHILENDPKAFEYLNNTELYPAVEQQNKLKYGIPIPSTTEVGDEYRILHNEGVILHYGYAPGLQQRNNPDFYYSHAISRTANGDEAAFSMREMATLFMDQGRKAEAEQVLLRAWEEVISEEGRKNIHLALIKCWMEQLVLPYPEDLLEKIKTGISSCLEYFESNEKTLQVALLLLDATHIANISQSYAEALGYIRRAIDIFEEEGMDMLAASAHLQKGTLLGTWAQNGNPQFFKPAIESYQKTLYTFTKENSPEVFADVQHKLGVLYAEMPDEHKKRGIWAGVSSASFHEALEFYSKEVYPYEYASICNNFANAYVKFPPAIRTDNHVKALYYYQEALEIRTADRYPFERAITLLNYLEASWNVRNDPSSFNVARFDDMIAKAEEARQLVKDSSIITEAERHLENLSLLKENIKNGQNDA
ncbi:MAG: hypothetical protein MRZ79_15400 [Bacteroidia bacterium]|nr:hypothetical protein [Bacteroidia bacterium]